MRLAAAVAFELDQREHVGDALGDFVLGQAFLLEAEGDVALDGEVREQRVALEHHIDRPPMRRHGCKIGAVEQDAAGVRPLEAGDQAQQRGLAAARGTEQGEELALINVERQMIDDRGTAEAFGQDFDAQQRTLIGIGPRRKVSFRSGAVHSHFSRSMRENPAGFVTQFPMADKPSAGRLDCAPQNIKSSSRPCLRPGIGDDATWTFAIVTW